MRCDTCNHGSFRCERCDQQYSFRVSDRIVDLKSGTSVTVTWESKGAPVLQVELSEEKVATWQWEVQRREDAEKHLAEIYEALEYLPDEETRSPMESIRRLRAQAARTDEAERIMQEIVDWVAEQHRMPDVSGKSSGHSEWQVLFARIRGHLSAPPL